jgi:hypothetical protein
MSPDRRDFLRLLTAVGVAGAPGIGSAGLQAQAASAGQTAAGSTSFDSDAVDFWTQLFQRRPTTTLGISHPGDERAPRFFVHTAQHGFRVPMSPPIDAGELEKFEHPSVKMRVVAFKPSEKDSHEIDASQSGTLRVDLLQSGMLNEDQPGRNASTAVSGLAATGSSALKPSSVNGLAIGGEEAFTLPGGGGYLNWTFFLQKKDAPWHKVLTAMLEASRFAASAFMPVLDLGAVGKKSWEGLNSMMGGLLPVTNPAKDAARSTFWVFTPGLLQVAASQKAYQDPLFADGVPLLRGAHYVVVPQEQYKAFGDVMDKMVLSQDGYIVPANTKPTDVFDVAYNTPEMNGISYLTVHCEEIAEAANACGEKGASKSESTAAS